MSRRTRAVAARVGVTLALCAPIFATQAVVMPDAAWAQVAFPEALTVQYSQQFDLIDLALSAGRSLQIGDRAVIESFEGSAAPSVNLGSSRVRLGSDARSGDLLVFGDLALEGRSRVDGDVRLAGQLTRRSGSIVTGSISTVTAPPAVEQLTIPLDVPPAQAGRRVGRAQQVTLLPGSFGETTVSGGGVLRLRSGNYFFQRLSLESQATLSLEQADGPVFIYVAERLIWRGSMSGNADGSQLLVGYFGTQAVAFETTFRGAYVAPNSELRLAVGSAGHVGSFFARDLIVDPNVRVRQRAFEGWPQLPNGWPDLIRPRIDPELLCEVPFAFTREEAAGARRSIDYCPKNFAPELEPRCTYTEQDVHPLTGFIPTAEQSCEVVGIVSRDDAPQSCEALGYPLYEDDLENEGNIAYCVRDELNANDSDPENDAFTVGEPIRPSTDTPPFRYRQACEEVAPSFTCCGNEDCTQRVDFEGLPAGVSSGVPCTDPSETEILTPSQCAPGEACVNGTCQNCVQFEECPDYGPDVHGTADPEFPAVQAPTAGQIPNPSTLPQAPVDVISTLETPCAGTSCRTMPTPIRPDAPIAADLAASAVDACQFTVEAPDLGADFGQGELPTAGQVRQAQAGELETPEQSDSDDNGSFWVREKGNERFNVRISAGVEHNAEFGTSFSDGGVFDLSAGASFRLSATIWEHVKEIVGAEARGAADMCGYEVYGDFRILGQTVQIDEQPVHVDRSDRIQGCEAALALIANLRRAANDRLLDLQTAMDFIETNGELDIPLSGAPGAEVVSLAASDVRERLVDNYRNTVGEYVEELQGYYEGLVALRDGIQGEIPFELAEVGIERRFLGVSVAYSIGPFQAGLEASASGGIGFDTGGALQYGLNRVEGSAFQFDPEVAVKVQATPSLSATAHVALFVGIGNRFAGVQAGIEGNLTLVDVGLPLWASMGVARTTQALPPTPRMLTEQSRSEWSFNWEFGAGAELEFLSGSVDLFLRARLLFLSKTWKKNIANWEGIKRFFPLFSVEGSESIATMQPMVSEGSLGSTFGSPAFPNINLDSFATLPVGISPFQIDELEDADRLASTGACVEPLSPRRADLCATQFDVADVNEFQTAAIRQALQGVVGQPRPVDDAAEKSFPIDARCLDPQLIILP
jgi:hypothetical protein